MRRTGYTTEFHLTELYDRAQEAVEKEELVLLASLDVYGAFGTLPHRGLLHSLRRRGLREHLPWFIQVWLTQKRFRLRLLSPQAQNSSRFYDITRGLPRGGLMVPTSLADTFLSAGENPRTQTG